jgi:hypothetical protein
MSDYDGPVMMTWLTRMSLLDTMEDLETPLLAQVAKESHDLEHAMLVGKPNVPDTHPLVRMWAGYEVALAAYCSAACVELNRRGVGTGLHLAMSQLIAELRRSEPAPFEQPPWLFDTDVLRSHRSNMVRRWPSDYADKWSGTPERWPLLWPFTDEDGSYALFLSGYEKKLLAAGERTLPKSIREKVENL